MRRITIALFLLVVASVVLAPVALAAKSYSAERFDVDIAVQKDGSLLVKETVVFDFAGGPFSTVFRDLKTDMTDGITGIAAQMDGVALPAGTEPGQVEMEQGAPIKVQWHMPPTSDSTHTFVLVYRMLGVVSQASDADVLVFNALPAKHDYKIASSTVHITYPTPQQLASPRVEKGTAAIETAPGSATFRSVNIGRNRTLRVSLRFAPGSVTSAPPQWQVKRDAQNQRAPIWIAAALLILAGGTTALAAFWQRNRRTITVPPAGELHIMRPPSDLPPAIAGMLKDDAADAPWQYALGTMLDLARRGVLLIEETTEKSRWQKTDFVIRLTGQPGSLRPHESGLLHLLFESKKGPLSSIKMSDLGDRIASGTKAFSDPLKSEMRAAGLFSPAREALRRRLGVAAFAVMIAGCAGIFLAIPFVGRFGGWPMLIAFAVLGLSMVAFVFFAAFSPQSDAAAQQRPRWQAFAHYVRDVAKGTQPVVGAALLGGYLPYAAAFGQAQDWARLFRQRGDEATLAWFRPLAAGGEASQGAFIGMIAASSSVSHGGGAAGAGGAAGGGASGAH